MGIPFSKRPTALRFDYKVRIADAPQRIRATGFSRTGKVAGKDHAAVVCLLQKRWEDAEGNVYAKRVGTLPSSTAKAPTGTTPPPTTSSTVTSRTTPPTVPNG